MTHRQLFYSILDIERGGSGEGVLWIKFTSVNVQVSQHFRPGLLLQQTTTNWEQAVRAQIVDDVILNRFVATCLQTRNNLYVFMRVALK